MARRTQTTIAKSVTPSMRAAAMIIEVRMSPAAVGWRAEPSMAAAASLPMPKAPPMTERPAPKPAARNARALGPMVLNLLDCLGGVHRAACEFPWRPPQGTLDYPWPGDLPGHV